MVDIKATVSLGMFETGFWYSIEMLPIRLIKVMFQVENGIKIKSLLVMSLTSLPN